MPNNLTPSSLSIFTNNLTFVKTEVLDDAFENYEIGSKIMLVNSGSYFVLQMLIFMKRLAFYLINKIATLMPTFHYVRLMGIFFDISG